MMLMMITDDAKNFTDRDTHCVNARENFLFANRLFSRLFCDEVHDKNSKKAYLEQHAKYEIYIPRLHLIYNIQHYKKLKPTFIVK